MSAESTPRKYQAKEEFVAGHSGTNAGEIFLLCLAIPVGLHVYLRLRAYLDGRRGGRSEGATEIDWRDVALEFSTVMVPMLLVQTSLLPYLSGPTTLLMGMMALASLIPTNQSTQQSASAKSQSEVDSRRPTYLSIHRACVYVLTTIAILAVDFPIFPRRFCKTEVAGYGWMDLGASSFIIIAGWASALASAGGSTAKPSVSLARKATKKCAPLLILGLIRLATNKGLEYQEHVSEYGVHWNFFFTLCFVEGFMVVWKGLKRRLSLANCVPLDGVAALMLMVPYQLFLNDGGQEFIESGGRRCDAIYLASRFPSLCTAYAANREGILGVVGYLALRLLSEDVARVCLLPTGEKSGRNNDNTTRQQRLLMASALFWMAHLLLTEVCGLPNSRRSTNAPFILWSLAHNISLLCLIHFVTTRASAEGSMHAPPILAAVNRFGLAVFLSSNILTGLTNLTVDTLHSSDGKAIIVLLIYLGVVCGFALLLDKKIFRRDKVD
ncbi:hypothetical protein ACHAXT_003622 [Thalassiosira profunda]